MILTSINIVLRRLWITGMLCLLTSSPGAVEYDWDALYSGHVLVESVKDQNDIPGVSVVFLVTAPRNDIWVALLDYDNFLRIFEGIDNIKVLDKDEKGAHIEFWVDAVIRDVHYVLFRDYVSPGSRLIWKRVSGDMKDIHGSWQIVDTADSNRKLVIYESFVDIGYKVATWFIQQGAKAKAEKMAHRFRNWVEQPHRN